MDYFCKNLRFLRKIHGKTQRQVAESLHITQQCLSQYESMKRSPDVDTISRFAQYFSVSVESLINEDLSQLATAYPDADAFVANQKKLISIMFPVAESEKALENSNFRSAFTEHKKLINFMMNNDIIEQEEIDFDDIDESYKAAATLGIIEAKINYVSFTLLVYDIYETGAALDALGERDNQRNDFPRFLGELIDQQGKTEYDDEGSLLDDELNEYIIPYVRDIKHTREWAELADFFIILLYQYGLLGNDLDFPQRINIVAELSYLAIQMKNERVRDYFKLIQTIKHDI